MRERLEGKEERGERGGRVERHEREREERNEREEREDRDDSDTAYKRWSCHSGFKLLCKLCRTSPPPAMMARFT